jgi:hypothetical protein
VLRGSLQAGEPTLGAKQGEADCVVITPIYSRIENPGWQRWAHCICESDGGNVWSFGILKTHQGRQSIMTPMSAGFQDPNSAQVLPPPTILCSLTRRKSMCQVADLCQLGVPISG